jgi:hypothetical protein
MSLPNIWCCRDLCQRNLLYRREKPRAVVLVFQASPVGTLRLRSHRKESHADQHGEVSLGKGNPRQFDAKEARAQVMAILRFILQNMAVD